MRATMTLGLALLLAVPLLAGDAAIDELVIEAKDYIRDFGLTPPDSIGGVIEEALPRAASARALFVLVRERFGLKEETSRLIVIATLRRLVAAGGAGVETEDDAKKLLLDLNRNFREALRSDPSNPAVAREYLAFLADDDNQSVDGGKSMREVLRGLPHDQRGLVALQVMSDRRVTLPHAALFEAVTEAYGLDPLALAIAGDDLCSSSAAEVFDRATALWLAQKDVESAAAAAARAIDAYSDRRSLADVLRIYRSLPVEAKAVVSRAAASEATVRSRGVERAIATRDVRLTLAAAFILGGDSRAALSLLPTSHAKQDDPEAQSNWAIAEVLRAAIDSPGGDAFDLVTNYLQHVNAKTTGLVDEVFDRVATRAGYAAAGKWRLDTVTRADERLGETERLVLPGAAAALLPVCSGHAEQAASPAVARLLGRAPFVSFVERPVDENARSTPFDVASRIVRPLPAGFDFLRMEARGDEVVAVASSHNIDPTGAASVGGYWILRSTDHGETWKRPLYTGLRVLQPYEVIIGSTLPMLRDDGVRIEAVTAELDGRVKEIVALDFKWRDLERDSDHDGLTDLMEERILTDPNSSDTDSDGLPDGVDSLPQVAYRRSTGDAAKIVAIAIEAYYGPEVQIADARASGAPTMFIAGDPADFAGVESRLRIIVMSDADLEAATKQFGPTLATHLSPVIIDATGTRAWLQLSEEGSGATYLLEKRDGVWTVLVVAPWVS